MAFPNPPEPTGMFAWIVYLVLLCVGIWVVMQLVPALATFISNL